MVRHINNVLLLQTLMEALLTPLHYRVIDHDFILLSLEAYKGGCLAA